MKFHLININGHIVFVFKNKKFKRKSVSTFNKIKCVQQMYSTFMKTSSREFYGLTKRIAFRIRTVAVTKAYVKLRSKISTSQIFSAKVQDVLCKVIYCTFVYFRSFDNFSITKHYT